ncbi:MAG: hypothetical protein NWE93_14070 [Candidatus Bathyarchaeota archaeon]|nr:hypothetical protein [Candidatus Bathyarchaeota archaeon]
MTEVNQEVQVSGIESKSTRITLTFLSVILLFAGPTYVPYLLGKVLGLNYFASIGVGFALFVVGLGMLIYLIRKKVIT